MNYEIRFWNPGKQYQAHREEFDQEIQRVLAAGDLVLREDVERFEENFAKFVGKKYCVGVNSGTDALTIAIKAVIPEYEVLSTSSHTFWATAEAIMNTGRGVFFEDVDERGIADNVAVPVHLTGLVARSKEALVEDACQALGAEGVGYSRAQAYSFYPAKILGCFGDGGAVTTNDKNLADTVRLLRNHGGKPYPKMVGYNSRLDNLQAAVLNVRLKYVPDYLKRRQEIAEFYTREFKDSGLELPPHTKGRVWQDYIVRHEQRDKLYEYLKKRGVETLKNEYPFPDGYDKPANCQRIEARGLRLPIDPVLEHREVEYVAEKVRSFLS